MGKIKFIEGAKKTLVTLATLCALNNPVSADPQFALGLSSPCHGLLALRGVYDFNKDFGIQADLGIGFISIDARIRKGNLYGYIGGIGISPWIYPLAQGPVTGPTFGIDLGVGAETNTNKKGLSFGIEGGLVLPIPPVENTGAFRVDINAMYGF